MRGAHISNVTTDEYSHLGVACIIDSIMCELLQWPTRPAAENFLSCMWWPHGYTCTVAQPNKLVVQTRRQAATLFIKTNSYFVSPANFSICLQSLIPFLPKVSSVPFLHGSVHFSSLSNLPVPASLPTLPELFYLWIHTM